MSKAKYLVDDEMDALDYADEYVYEEYKRDEKQKAKEEGREEKVKAPKPKPKAAPKPVASAPKKLTAVVKTALEPTEDDFLPVLEAVDDWEAAMDNLDAFVSKQEEQRQASAKKS